MISIELAGTSKRGDSLSSSDVMLAKGEAGDGAGAAGVLAVLDFRLWKEPYLYRRVECDLICLRQATVLRGIIESSSHSFSMFSRKEVVKAMG